MSFRVYSGEYLVSPVPLHYGFNYCSHGCFYCFANLNDPARRVDGKSLRRILKKIRAGESDTLEAFLVARGHPVLMANDSDPLAASNFDAFEIAHDAFAEAGVRMTYQTKGGKPEHERVMLDDAPTMIYVSLTGDDEDLLRQAEPGAPSFAARLDFIARAKAKGHHVVAGVNPLIHWWWNDFGGALAKLEALGVRHAWVGQLHLTHDQLKNMPGKAKERFSSEVHLGKGRLGDPGFDAKVEEMRARGWRVFDGLSETRDFWDAYFALGFPFYPTAEGFFQALNAESRPVLVEFSDFDRWSDIGFLGKTAQFKDFVRPFRRDIYAFERVEPKIYAQTGANKYYFDASRYRNVLSVCDNLYLASTKNEKGEDVLELCDFDLPKFVHDPEQADAGRVFWDLDEIPAQPMPNMPKM
jgi:DNA repair photolyase